MNPLVNIDVPDLDEAEQFYCAAFDLSRGRRLGQTVLELTGGTVPVYLLANRSGSIGASSSRRDYDRHWTPVHLDIVVENLEDALDRSLRAGARLEGDIREAAWGRIAQIADPFGHGWCLLQFLGRGYDEIAT